jgi:hypothetical protein
MSDYVPKHEGELETWAQRFANNIAAAPADYGVTAEVSAAISQAVERYVQALAIARNKATRTKANVAVKNAAKAAMLKVLRSAAQQIRANAAVSSTLKLGLQIKQAGRAAGTAPSLTARPLLRLAAVEPLRHVIGYGHTEAIGRSKPAGAIGLQLFLHVGEVDAAPAGPEDARFLRFISRQPYTVDFKADQIGKTAFYFARWQTMTGDTGPWSAVLKMTVAG